MKLLFSNPILTNILRSSVICILLTNLYTPTSQVMGLTSYGTTLQEGEILASEAAKLKADDTAFEDGFGYDISVQDNTVIVGAPYDDDYGNRSGAAYIFERDLSESWHWDQIAKLTPSDAIANDLFGSAVDIDEDVAAVGAFAKVPGGAVYIFDRDQGGPDRWGQVAKVTGLDTSYGDSFGVDVALSGDLMVVGAYASGDYVGSIYIFQRNPVDPTQWDQVAKLISSDATPYDYIGISVDISGETVVTGAPGNDGLTGAAYIFQPDPSDDPPTWKQVARLVASDASGESEFGISVSLSGDTLVVGASTSQNNIGSAYVFERNLGGDDRWGERTKLTVWGNIEPKYFGSSVSIDGDTILIGAPGEDQGAGAAYLFKRDQGGPNHWGRQNRLTTNNPSSGIELGCSVSVIGETAFAGAYLDAPGGSVYIFNLENTPPDQLWFNLEPNPVDEGTTVSIDGGFTDPDIDEHFNITLNWGDGIEESAFFSGGPIDYLISATHTYSDDFSEQGSVIYPEKNTVGITGGYTITLSVSDSSETIAYITQGISVTNVVPQVYAGQDIIIQAGEIMTSTGYFIDPGTDAWTASVDYGDSTTLQPLTLYGKSFELSHVYSPGGVYTVTVTVTDDDKGQGSDHFIVTVHQIMYQDYLPVINVWRGN
jgi:hypothetical protein